MACCGVPCEYIYAGLDAAGNSGTGVGLRISSDLLICDPESCEVEHQLDPIEAKGGANG